MPHSRFILLVAFTLSIACPVAAETIEDRWEVDLTGKLLVDAFRPPRYEEIIALRDKGIDPERESGLFILDLAQKSMEKVEIDRTERGLTLLEYITQTVHGGPLSPRGDLSFGRTSETILCRRQTDEFWGLFENRLDLDKTRLVLRDHELVDVFNVTPIAYDLPRWDGRVYSLLRYTIWKLPIRYGFKRLKHPEWLKDRILEKMDTHERQWTDLVAIGSEGEVARLSELETSLIYTDFDMSPNAQLIVRKVHPEDGPSRLQVCDWRKRVCAEPIVRDGITPRQPTFSPDGRMVAVVGEDPLVSGVYVCEAPAFDTFRTVIEIDRTETTGIERFSWSPNSRWILITEARNYPRRSCALLAVELATGDFIEVPWYEIVDLPEELEGYEPIRVHDWID